MSPATARARRLDIPARLAQVRRENPAWESWLGLLEAALAQLQDGAAWRAAVPRPATRAAKAPCLHGTEITLDGRAARRWIRTLLKLARARDDPGAASLAGLKARRLDALALLEAAVRQDDARLDALAAGSGADPAALRVVAQVAAMPLLHACGAALAETASPAWWEGYCPVCGAWPAFAELRGLDRRRWLRCGRCGGGWEALALRCPFCGEAHHERLGYLASDGEGDAWKIEVCHTCSGYIKAVTTVTPAPPWAVALDDLATVHLDLAAIERGYRRPERPGYGLEVRLREKRRGGALAWLGVGTGDA